MAKEKRTAKRCTAEINRFLRVADQRREEAGFPLEGHGRTTIAIYLAGYTVECTLKALLLATYPASHCGKVVGSFRGKAGHSFEWLRDQYLRRPGATTFPASIRRPFTLVASWNTELRYDPSQAPSEEARGFLDAVDEITRWVKGRL